jgi:hypothetical protein
VASEEYKTWMSRMTVVQSEAIKQHGGLPKQGNIYFSAVDDSVAIEAADGRVIDARGNIVGPKQRPNTGIA